MGVSHGGCCWGQAGRQEGGGIRAATGSLCSRDSVGFGGACQAWGVSQGWECWEQVSLHEGPSPGTKWSPRASVQRSLALMPMLAAPQMASTA